MKCDGRIHVLHMGLDNRRGGIESFLYNIAKNVDWHRYQFDYICYGSTPAFGDELKSYGANLINLPDRRDFRSYRIAMESSLGEGYDILHLHKNSPIDFLPVIFGKRARVKVIVHAHNTAANTKGKHEVLSGLGRYVINRYADRRLACSSVAAAWLFGRCANSATLVPNGIDINEFAFSPNTREIMRSNLGVGGRLVIGCVGRFVKQKNQRFLVDVLTSALRDDDSVVLVFLGDGPERVEIEDAFYAAGLSEHVLFLGDVSGISLYLQAFDVLVMPSIYEGLPLTAIEAQASGLPLVVSDTITDEIDRTELIYRCSLEYDPPTEWANAIRSAAPKRLEAVDLGGIQRFNASVVAEKMQALYSNLIRGTDE